MPEGVESVPATSSASLVGSRANWQYGSPAAACAFAPLALSAANAETLTRRGLVVVDDVLSPGELAAARRDAATLARFTPAGDHGERGDAVCWVRGDDDDVGAGLRQAMRLLRGVPDALARRGYEVIT